MKILLELVAKIRIKIKILIMYHYVICCKLKLNLRGIINYTCIEHIKK